MHCGKLASAFGSYGWSGEGVPHILERLHQLLILAVHILEHMSEDLTGRHRKEVGLLRLRIGININLVSERLNVIKHHMSKYKIISAVYLL
mgnify:CR=1 FL=1